MKELLFSALKYKKYIKKKNKPDDKTTDLTVVLQAPSFKPLSKSDQKTQTKPPASASDTLTNSAQGCLLNSVKG